MSPKKLGFKVQAMPVYIFRAGGTGCRSGGVFAPPYLAEIKWKRLQKVVRIQSNHLHLQWKFKLWAGKFAWGAKAKQCWALSTNFCKQKVCWHHPTMFCPITSSKLSRKLFEFSLKVKVTGSNPGYLLKSFRFYRKN